MDKKHKSSPTMTQLKRDLRQDQQIESYLPTTLSYRIVSVLWVQAVASIHTSLSIQKYNTLNSQKNILVAKNYLVAS